MSRLRQQRTDPERLREFRRVFWYEGDATCATDGLCSLACPVGIDTGKLIKDLRHASHSPAARAVASFIAHHMAGVTAAMRWGLDGVHVLGRIIGERGMNGASRVGRTLTGGALPLWNRNVPRGSPRVPASRHGAGTGRPAVVYFPTCINRTLGKSIDYGNEPATMAKTIGLLEKGGYRVVIPENIDSLCCGMAFDSKGFKEQGMMKAKELEQALLTATRNGEDPVYVDMSPCLFRMKEVLDARLRLYEPVGFIREYLARRLEFHRLNETVTIHTTCSATKMGLGPALKDVAEMCAERVISPEGVGCCGWAGDRGFTVPELTESALRLLKRSVPAECAGGYSTSRTCEIGLSLHSGVSYKSIIYLVDRCTMPGGAVE
jgi:D-lactate dehydrogenase